jgi:hypothetical protein
MRNLGEGLMKRSMAALAAVVIFAGCSTSAPKTGTAAIAGFQPGVTTVEQAEAALGAPFQSTRQPDGGLQLQYVTKSEQVDGDGMATTGSSIPKHVQKTVSTMLSFDSSGHFVRSWSNTASNSSNNMPSDLGHLNSGDVGRQTGS